MPDIRESKDLTSPVKKSILSPQNKPVRMPMANSKMEMRFENESLMRHMNSPTRNGQQEICRNSMPLSNQFGQHEAYEKRAVNVAARQRDTLIENMRILERNQI